MWAVLDQVVDDYEPVVEGLTADVEDAEVKVFEGQGDQTERIYFLKREAIEFYRAVHPLLAPLAAIERGADPRVTPRSRTTSATSTTTRSSSTTRSAPNASS